MPTNRELESQIKELIQERNAICGSKLSYSTMYSQLEAIMKIKDQKERDDAFLSFHCFYTHELSSKLLDQHSVFYSNEILGHRHANHPSMLYSISVDSKNVRWITDNILSMIDPEYAKKHLFNEEQIQAIHKFETDTLKSHSYYAETPRILKAWDYKCFNHERKLIDTTFYFGVDHRENHIFTGNPKVQADISAAEFFYKRNLIQQEIESYTRFERFLNFRRVWACRKYIAKVDEVLKKIGFDPARHADVAMTILKNTTQPPHDIDFEHVDTERAERMNEYSRANIEQITVARDKANKALELEKNPETSINKMIEPLLQKHNLSVNKLEESFIPSDTTIKNFVARYDQERITEELSELLRSKFSHAFTSMLQQAVVMGGDIDFNAIFNDSRQIAVMVAQRFTPYFQLEEFKNAEKPIYTRFISERWIQGRIDFYANNAQENIWPAIEKKATDNGEPIPEYVTKARKELTPEKIEALKAKGAEAVRQWLSNTKALVEEDFKLAESFEPQSVNNDEAVNENIIDDIIIEEDIEEDIDEEKEVVNASNEKELLNIELENLSMSENDNSIEFSKPIDDIQEVKDLEGKRNTL